MANKGKLGRSRPRPSFMRKRGRFSANQIETPWYELGLQLWEPLNGKLLKAVWVEFLSMVLFLYVATGVVVFGCHSTDTSTKTGADAVPVDCFLNQSRVLTIATGFGLSIFFLVYVAAGFSGGHINPAVTLAFAITGKISLLRAALYWIVQLGGAVTGSALVFATDNLGFAAAKGAQNRLIAGLPKGAGWLMETILTFALVMVVFAATDTARAQSTAHMTVLAPIAIGFTVFAAHLAAVAIDGCSINPARSFGPAVMRDDYYDLWIFFVGPFAGAILAALVYEITLRPSSEPLLPVDHVAKKGQHAEPAKLPGYAGVQGLSDAMEDDYSNSNSLGRTRRDTAHDESAFKPGTMMGNDPMGSVAANGTGIGSGMSNGIIPGKTNGRGEEVV